MKHRILWGCVLGIFWVVSGCVTPEQHQVLENRITALEMENNRQMALQEKFFGKEADLKTSLDAIEQKIAQNETINQETTAEIKYELTQLKEKYGQLQGMIEEVTHRFGSDSRVGRQDMEKRLDRLDNAISRNYTKILTLENYLGFEPTIAAPDATARPEPGSDAPDTVQTVQQKTDSEQGLYTYAKKLFDDGDMEKARIQFENFINKYPDSDNADNARFWIADSYYVDKWYEKAILEYQKVLEQYPDSNKAAAARLKQGYAFAELGEKANARLILHELVNRYPDSREAGFAGEKLKHLD
ncbi:MAG TPA: tol-pal system protein YbgF [Desulfotignum sp.]|nr:tol-pal system protein YbgF [Desulfotignum sp.]